MKKRILALALAGTTAFSVFGAAMSANAATYTSDSTHTEWNIDRYVSYDAAGTLYWNTEATTQQTMDVVQTVYTKNAITDPVDLSTLKQTLYVLPGQKTGNIEKISAFKDMKTAGVYFDNIEEFMAKEHPEYQKVEVIDGQFKVPGSETVYTIYADGMQYGWIGSPQQATFTAYAPTATASGTALTSGTAYDYGIDTNFDSRKDYCYIRSNIDGDEEAFKVISSRPVKLWGSGNWVFTPAMQELLDDYAEDHDAYYISDMMERTADVLGTNLVNSNSSVDVITVAGGNTVGTVYNHEGYETVDATDPTDFDAVMANEVKPEGEFYLYDYYYGDGYPRSISASRFASEYNAGTLAATLSEKNNAAVKGEIKSETGYGYGTVREAVIDEWYNFLDDLGILNASYDGLTRWAEDLVQDYAYQYYDALVVTEYTVNADGSYSITYTSGKNLDIYNFGGLVKDIIELAPVASWADKGLNANVSNAQTSEFIYLMQQYNKYMDGYVDPIPVDTNDWGDLLVSLAQAPTADEFATSNGYTRYSNKVDQLVAAYEDANTSGALKTAEADLYNFVTSYYQTYKYETKPDTAALNSAIDSTYYNYKWNGTSYTGTDYTSTTTGKAAKADVGYYVGATDTDGRLSANKVNTNLSAVAFYPAADYEGSVMDGAYPGVGTGIYGVTQEYNWFYNVYALAYDVLAGNKYQSTVDLMATTLEEAIDALVPTTSATAADVLGAEEQNDKLADLVETDYQTSMWANRNKIYNYITERVSNDETGHVGATNAEILAKEAAKEMGYQRVQTTVTRSEINAVSAAKTEAQNALTALRNDEENYNAAQANALQKAIDECDVIIDLYNGDYSKSKNSQSVNGTLALQVGDKDQILKSDCDKAVEAVDAAINFKNIIQGWSQDEDDNWMYGTEEGYLNDGWHQVDGGKTWFYFNEDGTAKQSEWWQDGSTWYYFNKNCGAAVGWAQVDGKWYFFKGNNAMKTGWEKVEGSWYYLSSSGAMVTGWAQIDGKWYYFSKESNALGQMLANTTTPDGYKVDANGVLVD